MAKKEIGRPQTAHIAPFGLRLQPELKEMVEAASKANGRSMNAEIVATLQEALDGAKDLEIDRLRREVKRLEGETAPFRMTTSQERAEILGLKLFALRLAKAIPHSTLQKMPTLAVEASEILQKERQIMMEVIEASIVTFAEFPKLLRKRIESGHLQVVPEDPANPPTAFAAVPDAAARGGKALRESLSELDEGFLSELFERPAVRAALKDVMNVDEQRE